MRFTFLLMLLVLFTSTAYTQSRLNQFIDLITSKDTLAQRQFLEDWHQKDDRDPELYVAYFNYYIGIAQQELVSILSEPTGEEFLEITTQDAENPETVGYIGSDIYYETEASAKALDWINQGIGLHPDRLDMRFGKIHFLGLLDEYEVFTEEVVKTIQHSAQNNNKWLWSNNQPKSDGQEFLLESIQDYQAKLFNTGDDSLIGCMERIALSVLQHYPKDIYSMSNLSVVYTIKEDYGKAVETLHKALKLAPKDTVIIGNLAYNYKQLGEERKAIKYYEDFAKYGDDEDKAYAAKMLNELKQ